jgi:hypothetical protein
MQLVMIINIKCEAVKFPTALQVLRQHPLVKVLPFTITFTLRDYEWNGTHNFNNFNHGHR